MNTPYGQASQFFGSAFNNMAKASKDQAEMQGRGFDDVKYGAKYDDSYMEGDVPPQTGSYGTDQGPMADTESVKEELLAAAREKRRPSNGSMAMRAGGGINYAVQG